MVKNKFTCTKEGCSKVIYSNGLCKEHFKNIRREGSPGSQTNKSTTSKGDICEVTSCKSSCGEGSSVCAKHAIQLEFLDKEGIKDNRNKIEILNKTNKYERIGALVDRLNVPALAEIRNVSLQRELIMNDERRKEYFSTETTNKPDSNYNKINSCAPVGEIAESKKYIIQEPQEDSVVLASAVLKPVEEDSVDEEGSLPVVNIEDYDDIEDSYELLTPLDESKTIIAEEVAPYNKIDGIDVHLKSEGISDNTMISMELIITKDGYASFTTMASIDNILDSDITKDVGGCEDIIKPLKTYLADTNNLNLSTSIKSFDLCDFRVTTDSFVYLVVDDIIKVKSKGSRAYSKVNDMTPFGVIEKAFKEGSVSFELL